MAQDDSGPVNGMKRWYERARPFVVIVVLVGGAAYGIGTKAGGMMEKVDTMQEQNREMNLKIVALKERLAATERLQQSISDSNAYALVQHEKLAKLEARLIAAGIIN